MAASLHATNVISINRGHRKAGAHPHRKLVLSPGARKVVPIARFREARRERTRVRKMERGSAALLVAASIAAALAIARFYLAKSTLLPPPAGMPTTW